jgi:hypothetical protein
LLARYPVITSVADPDPHHFFWEAKVDPDPHLIGRLVSDLDPHQSEKVKALVGHFGALEDPNLGKSEW